MASDTAWQSWAADLERAFVALVSICHLFHGRDAEPKLGALRGLVERLTQQPFDGTTLKVLCRVHGQTVKVEGGGSGDDESKAIVRLGCFPDPNGEWNTQQSNKRARTGPSGASSTSSSVPKTVNYQRRSFNAKPPKVAPLPALLATETAKLKSSIAAFCKQVGPASTPPPLHAAAAAAASTNAGAAIPSCSSADGGDAKAQPPSDGASGGSTSEGLPGGTWSKGEPVTARNLCGFLRAQPDYKDQLAHVHVTPAKGGKLVPLAEVADVYGVILGADIERALKMKRVTHLYAHQAEALGCANDVIVATPTSSGKSLVYTIPVVRAVLDDPYARALLLFPTKALAQDQLGALNAFADEACPNLLAATLDGDTARPDRSQLAKRAHVLLSNPDLLHATMLPQHTEWKAFFSKLKLVVLDEAHAYHGVFGSHVALVLRRLRRVCARYGGTPRFVCCSATIANPREHMARLTGIDATKLSVVTADAAPAGERIVALWNPPRVEASALIEWHESLPPGGARRRASSMQEASKLLAAMLKHELRTIAFVRTRAVAERLFESARELLPDELRPKIACYRAGYRLEERRQIERRLFGGELIGVVATTALELGVDVGGLDATLHLGYPGSTASLAQQAGRAGRGGRDAIAIMIAKDNPLEQHLVAAPKLVLERPLEMTVIDPLNSAILKQHLVAAAHEGPLKVPPPEAPDERPTPTHPPTHPATDAEATKGEPAPETEQRHGQHGGETVLAVPRLARALAPLAPEPEPQLGPWVEWRGAAESARSAGLLRLVGAEKLQAVGDRLPINLRDIDSRRVSLVVAPRRSCGASGAGGGGSGGGDGTGGGGSGADGGGADGGSRGVGSHAGGCLAGGPIGGFASDALATAREHEIETMEEGVAQLRVYDGAVYMHAGASYVVEELDLTERVARLVREDVGYYTEPRDHTRVFILGRSDPRAAFGAPAYRGPVRVSKHVYGYRKKSKAGGRLLEMYDLERPLPPMEYETRALWLELPHELRDALEVRGEAYARGGLHALEHLCIGLAPLCATCESSDLGCQCTRREGDEHAERFLIFERRRGGVGVADALLVELPRLLQAAQARLEACDCEEGCLACVHMSGCGEYNEGLEKPAAKAILRWLLQGELPPAPSATANGESQSL